MLLHLLNQKSVGKETDQMKFINFGIAIMVFGIVLEQALNIPDFVIIIGLVGLALSVVGFVKKEK